MSRPVTFILEVITPRGVKYRGRVISVSLRAFEGRIGILANHAPLVALTRPGMLDAKIRDGEFFLAVGEGFIKFTGNQATLLTEYAQGPEDVDVAAAMEKKQKLEQVMSEKNITSLQWEKKYWELQSALSRLEVSKKAQLEV